MNLTIHYAFLPQTDPDAALTFYRDTLGFEVRNDVGYGGLTLATEDLDGRFDRLQASGSDVVQEPTDQPYGVRDCAFRDLSGNLIRINQTAAVNHAAAADA